MQTGRAGQFLFPHLLVAVSLAFALGIAGAPFIISTPDGLWQGSFPLFLLAPLLFAGAIFLTRRLAPSGLVYFLLLLFVVSLGAVHGWHAGQEPEDPHHIFRVITEEQESVLIGVLDRMPQYNGEKTTLVLKVHSWRGRNQPDFLAAQGLAQLKLKGVLPQQEGKILPGDLLAVRALLDRPRSFRNPGAFDYPDFLAKEDIWITGRIASPAFVHRLEQKKSRIQTLRYAPEMMRARISAFIEQSLPPELSSVYKALLIGDASAISPEILEDFKGSGSMHILSISGAHLSILASFLFLIFYWLLRRSAFVVLRLPVKKIAAGLCLPPLILYTLLAGGNAPVVRSLIMVAVFMLAICADKQKDLFSSLALAALVILLWDPNSLLTASFQLSFAAVAAIITVAPLLAGWTGKRDKEQSFGHRLVRKVRQYTVGALVVSLAVTISTAPILLYYFNRVSLIGLVANLPVEFLICFWSLPLGFLAVPLLFNLPPIASLLLHTGAYGLEWSLRMTAFFNDFPLASLWLPTPSLPLVACYYLTLLAAVALFGSKRGFSGLAGAAWLLVVFFFFMPPAELKKGRITHSELTFLDVGQGSATVLELPAGKRILIDGGGSSSPSSGFNVGEDIIAPFLWQKGIKRLDAIVVTHADGDHYNGIPFLLQHFRPRTLWVNEFAGHYADWAKMLSLAASLNIETKIPTPGEVVLEHKEARLVNLGNPAEQSAKSSNDRSLILRFSHGPLSCLFAGDISSRVESQLLDSQAPLQSFLLLSPHHGSATSNSDSFLQAVQPQFLIVSASRFGSGNFPAPDLRGRCALLGITMRNTAEEGAIHFAGPGDILAEKGKIY